MAEVELVIGPMRAGKTTYAKAKDAEFISHDDLLAGNGSKFDVFFKKIVDACNASPEEDFIIDGWFSTYNWNSESVIKLQKVVQQKVKITVFYAPIDLLLQRYEEFGISDSKNKEKMRADIFKVYKIIIDFYKKELLDFEFTFRDSEKEFSFYEFAQKVRNEMVTITPQDSDAFLDWLKTAPHYDKYYQSIVLPHGRYVKGYERTEITWERVLQETNFRGKTVLDAGSYHCYCTFRAEDAGATEIIGIERNVDILNTAERMRQIWGYSTQFIQIDLDDWMPPRKFDIVMCFNTIQYPHKTAEVVNKLMQSGDLVIFEAHEKFKPIFDSVPTHKLVKEVESPRWLDLKRVLYFYERIK